ncbi:MAG: sugar kinase [Holophaga sp.]|jgi:2-dehydro-3-deoxygluconokinase
MKRIVTFGEIMLRLKSPGHERLFQSPMLEAVFGGGEANVAVSLATFGAQAVFVTALSKDSVGQAAIRTLRTYGVDVGRIRQTSARTGIYFLETGADQRPSLVVYDRAGSAAALMQPGDFPWAEIFQGADWFHFTGITPALSASAAQACMEAAKAARAAGATVSIDLNYRKKLWNYGAKAVDVMTGLAALADVLVANEEDIQLALGIQAGAPAGGAGAETEAYRELAVATKARLPNLGMVAITLRESLSADRNHWSAVLDGREGFRRSRKYPLEDIVDRVGGGDAFAAGLIFGLLEFSDEGRALEFAVAASALKHTIPGDFNLARREEVEQLAAGESSGRVQR